MSEQGTPFTADLSLDATSHPCPECRHERGVPEYNPWVPILRWLRSESAWDSWRA